MGQLEPRVTPIARRRTAASEKSVEEEQSSPPSLPAKVSFRQRGDAIARPRLFESLDHLTEKPISWIHAAAGAGKTTLLATYLASRGAPVLWYDVDAGDADSSSFSYYLRLGAGVLSAKSFALPVPRPAPPEAQRIFARRFFEAFIAQLPRGTVVVFDNYQEAVHLEEWNASFRDFCEALTPRVRVVVASRVAPPPTLARFRANDDLRVLPHRSLDLDEREVSHLLASQASPLADDPNEVGRLLSLTGGSAVAISLLVKAGWPHSHITPESATGPIGDGLQSVFDFLLGEVFGALDTATRELLLEIAVLPTFTAEMVERLTGRSDALPVLSKLHRERLLLERHGENGFRLHDLFRMFLLDRAKEGDPTARRASLLPAALLLAENDQFLPAVELLTGAQSWEALCDLVERHAPNLATQGRLETIADTIDRIPPEHRDPRPWLLYWRAAATLGRQGSGAHELAEQAFREFRAAGQPVGTLLSWALVVQAICAVGDDLHPLDAWIQALEELALAPPTPAIAAKVALSEIMAQSFRGTGSPGSLEVTDRAFDVVRRQGKLEERVLAAGFASNVYVLAGREHTETQRFAEDLVASAPDPLAAIVYLHSESVRAITRGRLKEAAKASEAGLVLARKSGIDTWTPWLLGVGAMSATASRDFGTAERLLSEMNLERRDFARAYHAHLRSWLAFEQGNIDAALRWAQEEFQITDRIGFRVGSIYALLVTVIYEATRGASAELRSSLEELERHVQRTGSPFFSSSAHLVKIYAELCLGGCPRESLRAALQKARQVGHFSLGRRMVSRLVAAALEYGIESEYAFELARSYDLKPGPEARATGIWPWPVKIRALGPLHIEVDGEPLRFVRKAPSVLLALLKVLVATREPMPLGRVSHALWPGYGSSAPRGTLDTALYRLRNLLKCDAAILHENGCIALNPELCWTDRHAFDLCCDRIAGLVSTGMGLDAATVVDCEEKLLDLYRGPLGNHDDPPPVARAREQLQRRFLRASDDLAALWLRVGERSRPARLAEMTALRGVQ